MTDDFKPLNNVQRLAYERRGVTSQPEWERMIGAKPWRVPRTTARYWWVNGLKMPSLRTLVTLSKFLRVPIDALIADD